MTIPTDIKSMAVFCDFENVALGVREAKYAQFDISKVLERLLLKGSIVVKKAYCDWERYKEFKAPMHQASFELIEIPHVRMSGKNSADIRMVVDALDLCYTKSHVDTFVIVSGDSDFSPLVSKLRENDKTVIGIGVKKSTSDLLIANCDAFIYYDDLVREQKPRKTPEAPPPIRNVVRTIGLLGHGHAVDVEQANRHPVDLARDDARAVILERLRRGYKQNVDTEFSLGGRGQARIEGLLVGEPVESKGAADRRERLQQPGVVTRAARKDQVDVLGHSRKSMERHRGAAQQRVVDAMAPELGKHPQEVSAFGGTALRRVSQGPSPPFSPRRSFARASRTSGACGARVRPRKGGARNAAGHRSCAGSRQDAPDPPARRSRRWPPPPRGLPDPAAHACDRRAS